MEDYVRGQLAELCGGLFLPIDRLRPSERQEQLSDLDRLFASEATGQVLHWTEPPDFPVDAPRDHRWRLASALQKGIRIGDPAAAMVAASALFSVDAAYLIKRLVICALEDVALGNLYGVAVTLALAGSKRHRMFAGERKAAIWLAQLLASGVKDRTLCNLCVVVDYDRRQVGRMAALTHASSDTLADIASSTGSPTETRMMAAWALAGTRRFPNLNVPRTHDRDRAGLMDLMAASRMPLILYYIADRAAIRGGGCLFVGMLPLWQLLQQDVSLELRSYSPLPSPRLGGVSATAFDMHTREGRAAIRRLMDEPEPARCLEPIENPRGWFEALCAAVFAVEGGRLDRRVSHPELDRLHFKATHQELQFHGLDDRVGRQGLMAVTEGQLELLHRFRVDALGEGVSSLAPPEATSLIPRPFLTNLPADPALPLQQAPKQPISSWPSPLPDLDPWSPGAGGYLEGEGCDT